MRNDNGRRPKGNTNEGQRMIVIADDITGAAEIAGIAFAHGQQVRLVCGCPVCCDDIATDGTADGAADGVAAGTPAFATAGTTVIATDTRSMTEAEAVEETKRLAFLISHSSFLIYKKTDSALRGHVIAELEALMETTGYRRAVYMPANPSKGRVIRSGTYYINDTPLHETAFSYDPEFPAVTSVLRTRFPDAEAKGIVMPDAENADDICRVVDKYNDDRTLFAGAADLFSALLPTQDTPFTFHPSPLTSYVSPLTSKSTLILCGSTQSKVLDLGIPIAPMSREVYDGSEDICRWDTGRYAEAHSIILTMPFTHRTGKEAAVHLRTVMARKAKELIARHRPDHLVIEGGATAWATLQAIGWTQFDIVRQIAPGVVQMRAGNGTLVTLKPGSYPWSTQF